MSKIIPIYIGWLQPAEGLFHSISQTLYKEFVDVHLKENHHQGNPIAIQADSPLETNCNCCLFIRKTKSVALLSSSSTAVFHQLQEYSVLKHTGVRVI